MADRTLREGEVIGADGRRKWDRQAFNKLARERHSKREGNNVNQNNGDKSDEPKKREFLTARDEKVDVDSKVGKTEIISTALPVHLQGGYFCKVCDCMVKDSGSYYDHINGKRHQRNLGKSMKIKRSTAEEVSDRLLFHRKKEVSADVERRIEMATQEEIAKKRRRRGKQTVPNQEQEVPEEMKEFGFVSFGSSKK